MTRVRVSVVAVGIALVAILGIYATRDDGPWPVCDEGVSEVDITFRCVSP